MLKQTLTCSFLFLGSYLFSQQGPTGTQQGNGNYNDWYRGGNNGTAASPNIFGSGPNWNTPLYTETYGTIRMKLNGSLAYAVNGFAGVRSGYLLLGNNIAPNNNLFNNGNFGAFSMLHLAGGDGSVVQEFGYRPWMKTGITFTDNVDLSYIGLRQVGPGNDVTETTITWSDNTNATSPGPDDMVFRFTSGTAATGNVINNDVNVLNDLDGLHIARFTALGLFGLGNTFGINVGTTIYSRPQSLLHISYDWRAGNTNAKYGFEQITYRHAGSIIGSGETENDGLRFGIDNDILTVAGSPLMHAYLRWQENSAFIVQTDWDNSAGGIENGERMRVTTIGAPGVPQPAMNANKNITRVAISHNGATPITEPRSLLHLGYNTGGIAGPSVDGWREWMDVGTFTAQGTDNMFVGLKAEPGAPIQPDRFDAVINWGDNQDALPGFPVGPDNLRFIFTSTTGIGAGDPISQSYDGLEVARMEPTQATTLNNNYGMVGIGNFAANNPNNPAPIDAKLDIDGDLRIRSVTQDNSLTQVLVIDPNDLNRVHYADLTVPTGNGFVDCNDPSPATLSNDSHLDLDNHNLYFEKNDLLGQNHTGYGYNCFDVLPAKVSVFQDHPNLVNESTIAISGINHDVANSPSLTYTGVNGQAIEMQDINLRPTMIGGDFTAGNGARNYGIRSKLDNTQQSGELNIGVFTEIIDDNAQSNYGSLNIARNAVQNTGVYGQANTVTGSPSVLGWGGRFESWGHGTQNVGVEGNTASLSAYGLQNFGVAGVAGGAINNYSIYGEVPTTAPGTNFWAGYFVGSVSFTGGAVLISDSTFKENIAPIDDEADSLLMMVEPYSYEYKQTGNAERLRLDTGTKFGVLAQQIEPYFPHMVKEVTHPAKLDSVGNIIEPSFQYKAVDLTQLIPVMLYDAQKKNSTILELTQSNLVQDSLINDLNNRLTQLENCLSGILPLLCQMSNSLVEPTNEQIQQQLLNAIDVELSDRNNIVLNQNVPNPFAERTIISYSIPETVSKAQINFYDGQGKLINSVDIVERGIGQINVFASDLSTGVYTYSLVADGQVVSTKRMVKE